MLLVSVTVLLSAPLLGRVARAESEAADALRAAAAAGTGGWDREHARFLYMFRVKMVRVLAVGLGSVLLLVSVLTTLLALGRIGADLLEGPETIHVEHCYGPWDRGQAPDGVVVHDDGLTLGAAQDHAVSQVLDRVHPRFHGKLPRDLRRGPRDAEQQSVRGAASSQDFSVVLGDVEGEDLPTHLDIRQSGSRGVEQRQPAPGTTRGHEIGRGGQGHDGNILSELEGAQDLRVVRLLQVDTQHLAVQVPYQRHPALPGRAV